MTPRKAVLAVLLIGFTALGIVAVIETAPSRSPPEEVQTPQNGTDTEPKEEREEDYNGNFSVLFVGNSYTKRNNLPGIYRTLIKHDPRYADKRLKVSSVMKGGYRLWEHSQDLENSESRIHHLLTEKEWDYVVLQEQSQIPGFSEDNPEKERSLKGVRRISNRSSLVANSTVLFMTWGRRSGDKHNDRLYPNYTVMQERLLTGYLQLRSEAREVNENVSIAPVGLAFREVYERSQEEGDPLSGTPSFYQLYSEDGSHPTLKGSYLAALTIKAGTVGFSTSEYSPPEISPGEKSLLVEEARDAVVNYRSRWQLN